MEAKLDERGGHKKKSANITVLGTASLKALNEIDGNDAKSSLLRPRELGVDWHGQI